MMKTLKTLCGALALVASMGAAAEAVGIYGSNIAIGTNSANLGDYTWYFADTQNVGDLVGEYEFGGQRDFTVPFLPSFSAGSAAYISAAELMTFEDFGNGASVGPANFYWRVYETGSATPAAFASLAMALAANVPTVTDFSDAAGNLYAQDGDKLWTTTPSIDFLSGLGAGDYTLEVYFNAATNQRDGVTIDSTITLLSNNSGANYKATFQVTDANNVPEPSALALAGLSLALLAATRRRKH